MKTSKFIFAVVLVLGLTISCTNSNQKDKTENTINQTNVMNDTEKNNIPQKITPCLWVEKDAKAVAEYYLSIFKDGKLKEYHQYQNPPESGVDSSFDTAVIEIAGVEFSILAAGPMFKFNEAISIVINCKDQAEVDYYWDALTKNGGQESSCGWCKDKYGLSWQVVPVEYFDLINSKDAAVREKAMKNTFKQKKLILSELK
ncbi:VOC family protein [Flavobacterium capsici]|uniref:VOC family protein n=1 Tax=Flavobacterium capsici TaxID=3075618 RepID=A0AA96F1A5_9FLAO|nr:MULTISPECIES: VOC family protein [unclassified Flavobacterium]WNM17945.1 VOC family protein [Flavobacterium sp. PMR2A8]WNM21997.1 VOC family protein [Flavobacterium sp. PMTSA4]